MSNYYKTQGNFFLFTMEICHNEQIVKKPYILDQNSIDFFRSYEKIMLLKAETLLFLLLQQQETLIFPKHRGSQAQTDDFMCEQTIFLRISYDLYNFLILFLKNIKNRCPCSKVKMQLAVQQKGRNFGSNREDIDKLNVHWYLYNNLKQVMGNTHKEVAKKQVQLKEQQDFTDAFDASKKMIEQRFSSFENALNMKIGDLQKVKGKYIITFSREIFFQTATSNKQVNSTIDSFVDLFSGGNIGTSIRNIFKTAYNTFQSEFNVGYNEKQSYFTVIGQMGDMYRIDYLFVLYKFAAQNLVSLTQSIQGSYLIVSSIDKKALDDDLNVYEIMINKQFPNTILTTKFLLLKLARAEKISDLNQQQLTIIQNTLVIEAEDLKSALPPTVIQQSTSLSLHKQSPILTARLLWSSNNFLRSHLIEKHVILQDYSDSWAHYIIKDSYQNIQKQSVLKFTKAQLIASNLQSLFQISKMKKFTKKNDAFLLSFKKHLIKMLYDQLIQDKEVVKVFKQEQIDPKIIQSQFKVKRWSVLRQDEFQTSFASEVLLEIQVPKLFRTFYPLFRIQGSFEDSIAIEQIEKESASNKILTEVIRILSGKINLNNIKCVGIFPNEIHFQASDENNFKTFFNFQYELEASSHIKQVDAKQIKMRLQSQQNPPIIYSSAKEPLLKDSWAIDWQIKKLAVKENIVSSAKIFNQLRIVSKQPTIQAQFDINHKLYLSYKQHLVLINLSGNFIEDDQ